MEAVLLFSLLLPFSMVGNSLGKEFAPVRANSFLKSIPYFERVLSSRDRSRKS